MADSNGYIGRSPSDSSVVVARQTFEPTGVTTTFTFASGYTVGYLDVYLNGARLIEGRDYTATSGSTVDLDSAATNGDVLELVAYKALNINVINAAENFNVGNNLTVGGYISAGGTITGSAFYGDGSNLTGISAGIATYSEIAGIATYATSAGIATYASTAGIATISAGLTGNPNIVVNNLTALGNISIAGTLTYEDVTNIDAIGLVTARSGIEIGYPGTATTLSSNGNAIFSGIITATSFVGTASTANTVRVTDSADTGSYYLPLISQSTVTGNRSLFVDSGISYDAGNNILDILTLQVNTQARFLDDVELYFGTSDDAWFNYNGTGNYLELQLESAATDFRITDNGTERFRFVKSTGNLGIGTTNPTSSLHVSQRDSRFGGVVETVSTATTYMSGSAMVLEMDAREATTYTYTIPTGSNIGIVSFKNVPAQTSNPSGTSITLIVTQNAAGTGNTTAQTGIGTNCTIVGYENGAPVSGISTRGLVGSGTTVTLSTTGGDENFVSFFIRYTGGTNTVASSYKVYVVNSDGFRQGTIGV